VRQFEKSKPDIIVWLTTINGTATADEILTENTSKRLYEFLDSLPGLFFTDGFYLCSEYGDRIVNNKRTGVHHDFPILKLKAWNLVMYEKVVHYDIDVLPVAPSGFDRMFGVGPGQDNWERKLLGEQDLVGAVVGSPINTGILLLKPSRKTYRKMCRNLQATVEDVYKQKAWGKFEKFENPFCDQDLFDHSHSYQGAYFEGGFFKGIWYHDHNWFLRHYPFNETADRYSDWNFFASWRDQGFLWFFWVLNKATRGKVLLTDEYQNKSFIFNPWGDPTCGSYPFISIVQASIHFMGPGKIQKMGLTPQWIDRVKKTVDEYEILRFNKLRNYHETWTGVIKMICCEEPEAQDYPLFWTDKEAGCIAFFQFCECNCHKNSTGDKASYG